MPVKTTNMISFCKLYLRHLAKEKLYEFLHFLNTQRSSITFTMEIEQNNKLFLDILVTRKSDDLLGHQVYRKSTHQSISLCYITNHYHFTIRLNIDI